MSAKNALRALFAALLVVSAPALAQQGQAPKQGAPSRSAPPAPPPGPLATPFIGVVDIQLVLRDSVAAQSVRTLIDSQRRSYADQFSKKEAALRAQEQELIKQRASMSAEQLNEKRRAMESQIGEFQRDVNQRRRQIEESMIENMRPIDSAVEEILTQIATERGLNLILPRQAVVLSANSLDLTGEVLDRLNKRMGKVSKLSSPRN